MYVLTKQDQKKNIHDVYYIPNLKHNIISVRQLMENGYDVIFKGSTCLILDKPPNRKLIAKIQMIKNRMFPLNLSVNLSQPYAQMPKMSQTHMRLYYGILGLVISLLWDLFFSKNTQWSKDSMFWMNKTVLVKFVYLESIKDTTFQ